MIIVSNTWPINYLILIGHINLLPELFGAIIIPQAVYSELSDASAPSYHVRVIAYDKVENANMSNAKTN
jgi:predicted nucleic acid-binding protein